MNKVAPKIGIFWIYNNTVIARNEVLDNVVSDSLMLHDTDFEHAVEWEKNNVYLPRFPELLHIDYQEINRGRVIYSAKKAIFHIYADRAIVMNNNHHQLVYCAFNLQEKNCAWHRDPHYRTFTA